MSFYVIAAVAALGGLLFGYDTGVISGALLFIRKVMDLSPTTEGVVVAIALAGAALGAATAGLLSDRAGRRTVILGAAGLFVVGAVISGVAQVVVTLLIGRFIVGLAIGVASMLTPLYLAEISRARDRGAIVSLNQLCITAGILISYLVDFSLAGSPEGWRWMLALGALPGVILMVGMWALPESPRWLAGHGRIHDARTVLRRLRGHTDVSAELTELRTDIAREGRTLAPASELLSPRLRRPLLVGVGLAMFQQITGVNTVIYFAPTIFPSRRSVVGGDIHPGHGGRGLGQFRDHDPVDWADRPRRPATAARVEPRRHDDLPAHPVGRLPCRRVRAPRLGRGGIGRSLHRLFRDRPRAGILAADRGDLSASTTWAGDEPCGGRQLELQPARLRDLSRYGRRPRQRRRFPDLRDPEHTRTGIRRPAGAGD